MITKQDMDYLTREERRTIGELKITIRHRKKEKEGTKQNAIKQFLEQENANARDFAKKKELTRQINEDFKCPCGQASLKEPLEISIKCRACNDLLLQFPMPSAVKSLDLIAEGGVNVQDSAKT